MNKINTATLLIVSALSATTLQAEMRQHSAHEHGKGEMNVAVDKNTLFLEMTLPGHDVIGFETISTDAQRKKVAQALTMMESADLWAFSADAQCSLTAAHASHSADKHDEHEQHDAHDDHDEHAKHDAHDEHKEHAHHEEHEHHEEHAHKSEAGGHLEFSLSAEFICKYPKKLHSMTVNTFDHMPQSKSLSVQVLGNSGQNHATVTSASRKVAL